MKGIPMRPCFASLAVLGLGSASLAAEPPALQALTSTSGPGAELLLDGDPATGWRPEGDATDEGVLLRFEQPVAIDGLSLRTCTGAPKMTVGVSLDGADVVLDREVGAEAVALTFGNTMPRSVFVRVRAASPGKVCLGELRLTTKGQPVAVAPPRQVPGSIVASSVLAPAEAFRPSFLFDHRLDFGWAEGDKGPGQGQSFTLTLREPVQLVAFELWNGYQRSEDHFRKNARARALAVSVDGGPSVPLSVRDTAGMQRLALPRPLKGRVWTFRVEGIYPGKSYKDLVLSELRLVDARGPLGVHIAEEEGWAKALQTRLAGSPLGKVADHTWYGVCGTGDSLSRRRLKLRTNGTFVLYEDTEANSEQATSWEWSEVVEGAWVVKSDKGPWATVEVFGRRQRSERSWRPYGEARDSESVRIAGGTLEVARVEDLGAEEFKSVMTDWRTEVQSDKVACMEASAPDYQELVSRGAFFVRGNALTDLFARP